MPFVNTYLTPRKFIEKCGYERAKIAIAFNSYFSDPFRCIPLSKDGKTVLYTVQLYLDPLSRSANRKFFAPSQDRRSVSEPEAINLAAGLTTDVMDSLLDSVKGVFQRITNHPSYKAIREACDEDSQLPDDAKLDMDFVSEEDKDHDALCLMIIVLASLTQDYYAHLSEPIRVYLKIRNSEEKPLSCKKPDGGLCFSDESQPPAPTYYYKTNPDEDAFLNDAFNEHNLVVLSAKGGVGKTQLALHFANERRGDMEFGFITFAGSMKETIASLSFVGYDSDGLDLDQLYRRNHKLLAAMSSTTCLIVDNADIAPLDLSKQLKESGIENMDLHFLVTTRSSLDISHKVSALPVPALLELMWDHMRERERGNGDIADEDLLQIIQELGGHTLAITIVAKTLNSQFPVVGVKDILDAIRRGDDNEYDGVSVLEYRDRESVKLLSILREIFNISKLSDRDRETLKYLSFFPVSGISSDFLQKLLPKELFSSMKVLSDLGWVDRCGRKISVHPVVLTVLRTSLSFEAEFYHELTDKIRSISLNRAFLGSHASEVAGYLNEVRTVLAEFDSRSDLSMTSAFSQEDLVNIRYLLGNALLTMQRPEEAYRVLTENDKPISEDLNVYNLIGIACGKCGDAPKALEWHQRGADLIKEDDFSIDAVKLLRSLGISFGKLNNQEAALDKFENALDRLDRLIKETAESQPATNFELEKITLHSCLGTALLELGKAKEAVPYHTDVKAKRRKLLGLDHPDVAAACQALSKDYLALEEYKLAEDELNEALRIRKMHTPDAPVVIQLLDLQSKVCFAIGDAERGEKLQREAKEIAEKTGRDFKKSLNAYSAGAI